MSTPLRARNTPCSHVLVKELSFHRKTIVGRHGGEMYDQGPTCSESRRIARRGGALRPPWTNEATVRNNCVSCGACIRACPEAILIEGPARTPVVNFHQGECTFCAACADACPEPVFRDTTTTPWLIKARISDQCLLMRGVECRSCTDMCEPRALRFDLRVRPLGAITLDNDACTGCGACVAACPVSAITIQPIPIKEVRA